MKAVFGILFVLIFVLWIGGRMYTSIMFGIDCEGYLKRAADANTVELASKQLDIALSYLEKNQMTNGYTSILYKTPDEDIGFWYNNIKSSYQELQKVTDQTSQLEKTNILMKLRETLLDNDQNGTSITYPEGISRAPNNTAWAFFGTFSVILLVLGCLLLGAWLDEY